MKIFYRGVDYPYLDSDGIKMHKCMDEIETKEWFTINELRDFHTSKDIKKVAQ